MLVVSRTQFKKKVLYFLETASKTSLFCVCFVELHYSTTAILNTLPNVACTDWKTDLFLFLRKILIFQKLFSKRK